MRGICAILAALLALVLGGPAAAHAEAPPHINHLFVIMLENENAEDTFGPVPPSPYLGTTLREAGAFIPNYFGIGHQSLDNYIALVSGQPPNPLTQADCQTYSDFASSPAPLGGVDENGVAIGTGCVYPTTIPTIGNQLERSGRTWHNYAQDMAAGVGAGETTSCRHPTLNGADNTQTASATNQYATRHVPFVYFHAVTDFETCARNVVDLNNLTTDLQSPAATPEYSLITPDLCSDGHDATCADGTSPGGFAGIDAFLREWVPQIQASPAYKDHGAILVTFDESSSGAESCCNEPTGPNTPNNGGPTPGSGGGRVGAVMLSPCIKPGTVTQTAYNHYSALRWTEDNFGLAHLGYAGTEGPTSFGTDVFSNPACTTSVSAAGGEAPKAGAQSRLHVRPRRPLAGKRQLYRFRLASTVAACRVGATIRFGGRRAKTNRRGRAHLKLRLRHPGKRVAVVKAPGCPPAKAPVHVKRRRHLSVSAFLASIGAKDPETRYVYSPLAALRSTIIPAVPMSAGWSVSGDIGVVGMDELPELRPGPVADRLSIWPLDSGQYGLDARFQGRSGFERMEIHEAALKESGVRYSLVQELGDGWTLRFGPLSAAEVSKAFTAFVR